MSKMHSSKCLKDEMHIATEMEHNIIITNKLIVTMLFQNYNSGC